MLRVIDFDTKDEHFILKYEFDNILDEMNSSKMKFSNKREAYSHYAGVCWHYSIQCFDKIRFIADQYAVKYPEWIDGLVEMDYAKLATTVLEKSKELQFKDASQEVQNYLTKKVNNVLYAVKELQKICTNQKL